MLYTVVSKSSGNNHFGQSKSMVGELSSYILVPVSKSFRRKALVTTTMTLNLDFAGFWQSLETSKQEQKWNQKVV